MTCKILVYRFEVHEMCFEEMGVVEQRGRSLASERCTTPDFPLANDSTKIMSVGKADGGKDWRGRKKGVLSRRIVNVLLTWSTRRRAEKRARQISTPSRA